jgi:biopolymer transport protein ExbD
MAGGGPSFDDDGAVFSEINVTPLVDVMLVLLVIMMVTAPMLSEPSAIVIDLPSGKTGEAVEVRPQARTLTVGKGGVLQMDGAMYTMETLGPRLTEELKVQPDLELGLAADKGVEYGVIIQVLDTIRSAGVTRFALQMEPDEAAALTKALQAPAAPAPATGP